ncbi:UDP-N-acetylglucosamine-N-acetylmuramyl-pyrophosphoryl-undecaprenol [Populus alba x Populus x berolinensis]|uniref:UDP-N-acetylglucosamine-N-acetylmuramyl-pyrophosphoryl-undecaprenol n=1 Tax=Populus alba x Populus x berolinensis TaxID=444605 RepID=A0AAD6M220_9ROSI|nr:UDP-N-acetylglucosamine-N-acetylmuramyl-pyrophosphoryl-undecaprenol [Populus alba x Populus x berolinensis]
MPERNPPCLVASFQTFCFHCAVGVACNCSLDGWRQHILLLYPVDFYFSHNLFWVYLQLGSLLSMRGCYQYHKRVGGDKVDIVEADAEQGCCVTSALGKGSNTSMAMESSNSHEILDVRQPAGKWAFIFQIIFQMNAGAVMLTDSVFWFVLVPFLASKDYQLNALIISMHSLNAVFLLGDTALNRLRFPLFRIAYFFIWTIVYVLFQWIVHAIFRLWWPYPFLDLSSPYAPLWY